MGCNSSQEISVDENDANSKDIKVNESTDEQKQSSNHVTNNENNVPCGETTTIIAETDEKDEDTDHNGKSLSNDKLRENCGNDGGGSIVVNGSHDRDEGEAATKIQAAFRGHQVRATMKQSETTSNKGTDGKSVATNATSAVNTIVPQEPEPSKAELEAEFSKDDKELCDAAVRIQATFRGHLARKLATNEGVLKDEKDLQEITKKVAEELDIDLTDPELNKAATKIQASFRGHKVRATTDAPN